MKIKSVGFVVLILTVLWSIGCSSPGQGVYYLGNKAYARDPETGKVKSWEGKPSEETKHYDEDADDGASVVTELLNCAVN